MRGEDNRGVEDVIHGDLVKTCVNKAAGGSHKRGQGLLDTSWERRQLADQFKKIFSDYSRTSTQMLFFFLLILLFFLRSHSIDGLCSTGH
jgi:hypothetical protein